MNEPQTTYADFLAYAEAHDGLIEFVDGRILDHGIPSDVHQDISLIVASGLRTHLAGTPCKVRQSARLLTVETPVRQKNRAPDIMVVCPEVRLIFEISSPNQVDDYGDKVEEYRALPTCAEYIIIDSTRRRVRRYYRQGELFVLDNDRIGGILTLSSVQYLLDLDALYSEVRL